MKLSAQSAPWGFLLAGRFDSKRPGRTLWGLFADQHREVFTAVGLHIIKQAPASLLPLFVGMIVDTLTSQGQGAFRKVLWLAGGYLLLLVRGVIR